MKRAAVANGDRNQRRRRNFRLPSLAPDDYTVTVQAAGYKPLTQNDVLVFADQVQTLDLRGNVNGDICNQA
jgi:hypothetical protein